MSLKTYHLIKILLLILLCITTIFVYDSRWSYTEMLLPYATSIIFCCMFFLYAIHPPKEISISLLDVVVCFWYLYYVSRFWIGGEFPCATQFLKDSLMFVLYVLLRYTFLSTQVSASYITVLIIFLGCFEALFGIKQLHFGGSNNPLFSITGSFLNPGPLSAYLILSLILIITAKESIITFVTKYFGKYRQKISVLYFIIIFVLLYALSATWSRAAYTSLIIVLLWIYRQKCWRWRYYILSCLIIVLTILYFAKQDSADGRVLTWYASFSTWIKSFFFGVGIGGFHNSCSEGIYDMFLANSQNPLFYSSDVSQYAFCDLLKIFVEQGIFGGILCLCVMSLSLWNLYNWSRCIFYGVLSIVIFSFFSYPFELYTYRVLIVILCSVSPHSSKLNIVINKKWEIYSFLTILSIVMISLTQYLSIEIKARYIADKKYDSFRGVDDSVFIKSYNENLCYELDNSHYLFDYANMLRKSQRYNDSNSILKKGCLISNDPMFYVLMGNNFKDMGNIGQAELAYEKAFGIMPNRLYPLYKLLLLYIDTNQSVKSNVMAKRIVNMNPKIKSNATKDMILFAKKHLESLDD